MTSRAWLLIVLFAVSAVPMRAQQVCPCVPVAHEWIVRECDSWNCAAAATIMANGDPNVLSMPTGSDDFKWVIIRRIPVGSATIPADAPFKIETFSTLATATSRFESITPEFQPMLLTAPDGQILIVSRSAAHPRRRAAGK